MAEPSRVGGSVWRKSGASGPKPALKAATPVAAEAAIEEP